MRCERGCFLGCAISLHEKVYSYIVFTRYLIERLRVYESV